MSEPVLIFGAPEGLPDLFHAIPVGIGDPFLYLEAGDRRAAAVGALDAGPVEALGIEVLDPYTLGLDDLIAGGATALQRQAGVALAACRELGITEALVPAEFPLGIADLLRRDGVALIVSPDTFVARRRAKTPAQVEGVRRAQKAADAAMAVAAALIRELRAGLTSDDVREAMAAVAAEHDADLPRDVIVAGGAAGAEGHNSGSGPLRAGEPVVVDIWPQDRASRCWADMTRTFVAGGGEPDAELAGFWRICRESLEAVHPLVRAGADAAAIFRASCEPFIAAGQPTQLTKAPGEVLRDGFSHSLGHGVGLEIHERPNLGRAADTLVAGDVIAVEPGCYRQGYGGCRLEDLVLVTEAGGEILTDFPYDL
ncbi:MAG: M24 family metallopeptidase [Solirubrobacteraceae bacterium]